MMRILGSGLAIALLCYLIWLTLKWLCLISVQAWEFMFFLEEDEVEMLNAQRVIAVALGAIVIPIAFLKLVIMWMEVKE